MKKPNYIRKIFTRIIFILFLLLFVCGTAFLSINALGLIIPLRNPAIYQYQGGKDITLTYQEALAQINKYPDEVDSAYIYRLTHVVNQSLAQYWSDEGIDTYHMRVPIWENYILWFMSFKDPHTYLRYEFVDYKLALERGIGLCSEHALVMEQILQNNGLQAYIIGLAGHVAVTTKVGRKWFILDADQGIVMPYSLEEVEQNPQIVRSYYRNSWDPELFVSIYTTKSDNVSFDSARTYSSPQKTDYEETAYRYKWIVPIVFMVPLSFVITVKKLLNSRNRLKWRLKRVIEDWAFELRLE
jgi:hypothetical protein